MLKTNSLLTFSLFTFIFFTNFESGIADPPNNNPNDPFRNLNLDSIRPYIPAVIRNCSNLCDANPYVKSFLSGFNREICVINGVTKK